MNKKSPQVLLILLFIFGILLDLLIFVPADFDKINELYTLRNGLRLVDAVLVVMLFITTYSWYREKKYSTEFGLRTVTVAFALYLLYEIIRNVSEYGISAPGEFRFHYLILAIIPYLALTLKTQEQVKSVLRLTIVMGLFIPLFFIFYVGFYKGWSVGADDRFLPSATHMGMLYSTLLLYLSNKHNLEIFDRKYFLLFGFPFAVMLIADSHRSVWSASFAVFIMLIVLKEIHIKKIWKTLSILIIILGIVGIILTLWQKFNIVEYVEVRSSAFINPEDDPTSNWRLVLWEGNMEKFFVNPWLGEGLGGYWPVYMPLGDFEIDVFPHSLYVMILVKLGVAGMCLYLLVIYNIFTVLKNKLFSVDKGTLYHSTILLSIIVLIASHVYFITYSFDYFSLIYIGIGIASACNLNREQYHGSKSSMYSSTQ
jgi:O-antigen ligase